MLKTVKLNSVWFDNVLNRISETNNRMAKFSYSVCNYDIRKDGICSLCDITITYSNDCADVVKKPAIKKINFIDINLAQYDYLVDKIINVLMAEIGYKLTDIVDYTEDGSHIDFTLVYQLENTENNKIEHIDQQIVNDDSAPAIVKTDNDSMIIRVLSVLVIILLSIYIFHRIFCNGHDEKDDKHRETISEQYDALVIQNETNSVYQISN